MMVDGPNNGVVGPAGAKLLISPTEPRPLKAIGEVSLAPERNGVDVMWGARGGLWGVQRKELGDLLASKNDGRLSKELAQMGKLEVAVLLVEGRPRWTTEGELMSDYLTMSRRQYTAMLWSVRMRGVWVEFTDDLSHTIDLVRWLSDWSRKERHSGMRSRPGPAGNWGHVSDREWGIHLLSGIDGIGPGVAGAIFDAFGRAPLRWDVSKEELMGVKGIGPKRAGMMVKALGGDR
jgi:ERCC4-type nuclease